MTNDSEAPFLGTRKNESLQRHLLVDLAAAATAAASISPIITAADRLVILINLNSRTDLLTMPSEPWLRMSLLAVPSFGHLQSISCVPSQNHGASSLRGPCSSFGRFTP